MESADMVINNKNGGSLILWKAHAVTGLYRGARFSPMTLCVEQGGCYSAATPSLGTLMRGECPNQSHAEGPM